MNMHEQMNAVVGLDKDEALERLRSEFPKHNVNAYPFGMAATREPDETRIRIWFDPDTKTVESVTNG